MKKIIISVIAILLILTNIISYTIGCYTFEWGYNIDKEGNVSKIPTPYIYNTSDALISERVLCNSVFDMLHMYWQHKDVEVDSNDSIISRHNYFDDVIAETDAYYIADSIMQGDWEDFWTEW